MFNPYSNLFKSGTKLLKGVNEVTQRNIEAVKKLSQITRTSLGPNGMNKMVINHLGKLFVTHDAATIMQELEVIHPAAKMVVMASESQEKEVGDATNLVVVMAGEFLLQAENLLRMGLHTSDIIEGYEKASKMAYSILDELVCNTVKDLKDQKLVENALRSSIASKQYGYEDLFAPMVAKACIQVCPKDATKFNVDNIRVVKIPGGSVSKSTIQKGFILTRKSAGSIKHLNKAKVAVFGCPLDASSTETKSTIVLNNAEDLLAYTKSEEQSINKVIKAIADSGVTLVVTGGTIGDNALHYCERYKLMVMKVPSKFDLRRVCRATGARVMVRLGAPTAEEMGYIENIDVKEIGDTHVTVFTQAEDQGDVSTIIVRGSSSGIMDDVERAIDDSVNVYKALTKSSLMLPGAGATELELAQRLSKYAGECKGLDQYAVQKYGTSFEIIPRTLAENCGLNATKVITALNVAHSKGKNPNAGVAIEAEQPEDAVMDAVEENIFDSYFAKRRAFELSTRVALEVLRVDQIIMARRAGGPKPPKMGSRDA